MDSKVNISYIETNIEKTKASKQELYQAMKIVDSLHKRLSQTSMLVVEIARVLVPDRTSVSHKKEETE